MISIAMVVVLMLGITKVFSLTAQTAGATNQLSSFLRDSRAAQAVFYQDLSTAVSDGAPCMLLCSSRVNAFRNKADEQGDRDNNALTVDLNGNNIEGEGPAISPGEIISPTAINNRSHRIDTFSFFSRQRLQRQTGGTSTSVLLNNPTKETPLLAEMSSNEAWIWYGHLQLPDNNGNFNVNTLPGAGTLGNNQNNLYASQWILGREAILLRQKDAFSGRIDDRKIPPNPQAFVDSNTNDTGINLLKPLYYLSTCNAGAYKMYQSRFDLANMSIDKYLARLNTFGTGGTVNWWGEIFCGGVNPRFQANPFVTRPINASTLSQQAPILLTGCTQFIVEYAGDFVAQDNDPTSLTFGEVTNTYFQTDTTGTPPVQPATDGQIDYLVTLNGGVKTKQIRWYGLPRDTNGDNSISAQNASRNNNALFDVVPLRDVIQSGGTNTTIPATLKAGMAATGGAPFEKFTWTQGAGHTAAPGTPNLNLANITGSGPAPANSSNDYAATSNGMNPNDQYICAFGPTDRKPQMIRITYTLDDPSGTLPDGVAFQYVFTLP
jgi:hypothetical protein